VIETLTDATTQVHAAAEKSAAAILDSEGLTATERFNAEIDCEFATIRFMLGRPSRRHFSEFASCTIEMSMYDFSKDAHWQETNFPGSLKIDEAFDMIDEESGLQMILVKMTRYVRPNWEDRLLKRGEICWVPVLYAMEMFMSKECRWATKEDMDAAEKPPLADDAALRSLRRMRDARRLHSLAPAGTPFRRGFSDKDGASRHVDTKG
jgi:hypothetical protein